MSFSSPVQQFDLIVCGAGPGGLAAALRFLELSDFRWKVALLDKKSPWHEPVACAEAIHRQTLINMLGEWVDRADWVRTSLDGVDFVSPNGTKVRFYRKECGLILNRAAFHRALAQKCEKQGAVCHFSSRVVSIEPVGEGTYRKVAVQDLESGTLRELEARYVIDATGAGSRLGNREGAVSGNHDLEVGAFAIVKGLEHDPRYIQLHYGQKCAPGGYAWLFPRDGESVNVGVVVDRAHLKSDPPRQLLERMLETRWKGAIPEKVQKFGGPIPCGQPAGVMGGEGLFWVGDAASMVNPLSRGGILEAMKGGRYAAESVISLLEEPQLTFEQAESEYRRKWWEDKGRGHRQLEKAKKAFASIDDRTFDRAANRLSRLPDEKRTLLKIFLETLLSSPLLLWRLRSLLR